VAFGHNANAKCWRRVLVLALRLVIIVLLTFDTVLAVMIIQREHSVAIRLQQAKQQSSAKQLHTAALLLPSYTLTWP